MSAARRREFVILVALIAAGAVASGVGASLWWVVGAGVLPWLLYFARRFGAPSAIPFTVVLASLGILAVLLLTPLLGGAIAPSVVVAFALAGLAGALCEYRASAMFSVDPRELSVRWFPPLAGALVWVVVMAVAQVAPAASRLSWVLQGDSANNILFTRAIFANGGIAIGPNVNPVPLPAALIAIGSASGRSSAPVSELLRHDIAGMASTWGLLVAVACVLVGSVAAASIPLANRVALVAVGALASMLPLTWYVTGFSFTAGYINAQPTMIVVLCCWLVYLLSRSLPVAAFGILCAAATLLLAIWGPFVLFPAAFALVIVVRERKALLSARKRRLVFILVAFAQLVGYGLVVVLPTLLAQGRFLAAVGSPFPVSRWLVLALAAGGTVLGLLLFRFASRWLAVGLFASVAAMLAGLGGLAFAARGLADPLAGYYSLKFEWLAGATVTVIILGAVCAGLALRARPVLRVVLPTMLTALAVIALVFVPPTEPPQIGEQPLREIVSGGYLELGDRTADRVADLAARARPALLWRSGVTDETTVDFWVLEMRSGSLTDNTNSNGSTLRQLAYAIDPANIQSLCFIVVALHDRVTIYTADSGLKSQLSAECPAVSARFERSLGS